LLYTHRHTVSAPNTGLKPVYRRKSSLATSPDAIG